MNFRSKATQLDGMKPHSQDEIIYPAAVTSVSANEQTK